MYDDSKIRCEVCGKLFHQLSVHLSSAHKMSVAEYSREWPDAPIMSKYNEEKMRMAARRPKTPKEEAPAAVASVAVAVAVEEEPATVVGGRVHAEVLNIGAAKVPVLDSLAEQDVACVPEHDPSYIVSEDVIGAIALGIELYENVLMVGPTGTGKTSSVQAIGAILNWPITRINLNGDTVAADLIGDVQVVIDPESGHAVTHWQDGPLVTAMRRGHIVIIDEVDSANPSVLFVLQRLTERHPDPAGAVAAGRPHASILLPDGTVVGAHPHFRLVATANTVGSGDLSGDYAATNVLNQAFLDRWGIKLRISYPAADEWATILTAKTGLDAANAVKMVAVANKINKSKADGHCRLQISPRRTITWARLLQRTSAKLAIEMAVLNGLDPSDPDRQFALDAVKHVFGAI